MWYSLRITNYVELNITCDSFWAYGNPGITFTFDANVLGRLPTHAGIVWTDGAGTITFEAFDSAGDSLGTITMSNSGDGSWMGCTGEDRFFGVVFEEGISAIWINNNCCGIEVDHLQYGALTPVIDIAIDLKPQACPNKINVKSKGVLPVAILGTQDFDVNEIDPTSARLEGVAPIRSNIEDVATPEYNDECNDYGPDGVDDLTLKFNKQEIVNALGDINDGDEVTLELTGELYDGTPIEGEDVIVIKKKGKDDDGDEPLPPLVEHNH